jgi:hypothetical protein
MQDIPWPVVEGGHYKLRIKKVFTLLVLNVEGVMGL